MLKIITQDVAENGKTMGTTLSLNSKTGQIDEYFCSWLDSESRDEGLLEEKPAVNAVNL